MVRTVYIRTFVMQVIRKRAGVAVKLPALFICVLAVTCPILIYLYIWTS